MGVSSWSVNELPVNCTPSRGNHNYKSHREDFCTLQKFQLQNQCRKVKGRKLIASGVAIDWFLDTSDGVWTQPYPPDARTKQDRQHFRNEQIDLVISKGWTLISIGDVQWPGAHRQPGAFQISWEDQRPIEERERALGRPDPALEPALAPTPLPVPATELPSLPAPAISVPAAASAAPSIRVKPEPIEADSIDIPPPMHSPTADATSPAVTGVDIADAASELVSKEELDPAELPTSLTSVFEAALTGLKPLGAALRAADLAHGDFAAIERAELELANFQKVSDTLARRLGIMRRHSSNQSL